MDSDDVVNIEQCESETENDAFDVLAMGWLKGSDISQDNVLFKGLV
jgi:hypothetical protein